MTIPNVPSKTERSFLTDSPEQYVLFSDRANELPDSMRKNDPEPPKPDDAVYDESFLNLINDPAIVFDPENGSILGVNEQACRSYQIRAADLIDSSYKSLWENGDEEKIFVEKLLSEGAVKDFKASHRRADRSVFEVGIKAVLVRHAQKRAVVAISRDETEKLVVEQHIRRARREWTDTVDAVSDLIILEDGDGNLRRCNKATAEFFGCGFLELVGKPV